MKKPWSISTTIRNPDRLQGMLRVLMEFEGAEFSATTQVQFQIRLIQERLYGFSEAEFYNNLTKQQIQLIEDGKSAISNKAAKEIFDTKKYSDPPIRGRQSFNPLRKLGFVAVSDGKVIITELGKYFSTPDCDYGEVFFRSLIKLQFPNPDSRSFSLKDGFNIRPFLATLHLINEVNNLWQAAGYKAVGISSQEFDLFVPTLINFGNIIDQANEVIRFRQKLMGFENHREKKKFIDSFSNSWAAEFAGTKNKLVVANLLDNLHDYGDNAIRYFRLTKYIYIRGGGYYVDLEPRRKVEIKSLLKTFDGSSELITDKREYVNYISDISQPVLPWETTSAMNQVIKELTADTERLSREMLHKGLSVPKIVFEDPKTKDVEQLKHYSNKLRSLREELFHLQLKAKTQDISVIKACIESLKNIRGSDTKPSIELERLATLALNALNDAIDVKPNYPVGDDNEPTFTAPRDKPDIECKYVSYNAICEVTMLTSRNQWVNEGQPVMRHLRDFEVKSDKSENWCVFIAPSLHRDTINTFWISVKYEYEGDKQNIVPLTISQLITLLETLISFRKSGRKFQHKDLRNLYLSINSDAEKYQGSSEWASAIPQKITDWSRSILPK